MTERMHGKWLKQATTNYRFSMMAHRPAIARTTALILALMPVFSLTSCGGGTSKSDVSRPRPQETCPVMGGKVDKSLFVDAEGYRIYVCCEGCLKTVKGDPGKYIEKIKANGEIPVKVPADEADKESNPKTGDGGKKTKEGDSRGGADDGGGAQSHRH